MNLSNIQGATQATVLLGTANWAEAITALASALTALAVIFAALQVVLHNRQTHRDFESLYLQRFWSISDKQNEALEASTSSREASTDSANHAYLELSNDQISLRELGRITDGTWRFWEEAIHEKCTSPPYLGMIKIDARRATEVTDSSAPEEPRVQYRHLHALLDHHKVENGNKHERKNPYDPLEWGLARRKFNGL